MTIDQIIVKKCILANSLHFFEDSTKLIEELKKLNKLLAIAKCEEFCKNLSNKEVHFIYRKLKYNSDYMEELLKELNLNPLCNTYDQYVLDWFKIQSIQYLEQVN